MLIDLRLSELWGHIRSELWCIFSGQRASKFIKPLACPILAGSVRHTQYHYIEPLQQYPDYFFIL